MQRAIRGRKEATLGGKRRVGALLGFHGVFRGAAFFFSFFLFYVKVVEAQKMLTAVRACTAAPVR